MYRDIEQFSDTSSTSLLLFGHIPLTLWVFVEAFVLSSILIICTTFVAQALSRWFGEEGRVPEMERLLSMVQFMFADVIGDMIFDDRIRLMLAFMGVCGLKALTGFLSHQNIHTASGLWLGSVGMTWVNIITDIILPDTAWSISPVVEVVAVLSFGIMMQSLHKVLPGVETLTSYVEWHLANVISNGMKSVGFGSFEVIMTGYVLFLAASVVRGFDNGAPASTLYNIAAIVVVNNVALAVMAFISTQYANDLITVVVVTIIFAQVAIQIAHEISVRPLYQFIQK